MVTILQVDFPLEEPFGNEMAEQFEDLATSINHEPGFLWNIWTENESEQEAGGIYAVDNKTNARKYLDMHSQRIQSMGVPYVNAKIFDVNEDLTQITKGRLD
ncbi:monooxygenase [Staphylococcus xylosus]|uniref:monooxygenase n=1 Tax=Staphylococcus xylosus TaxID=1288 RepID=UPI002DBD4ECD|nr:monooxygenase [Staphylococcus xylosus]MEB8071253.1 monooxygenase [Staphylococcus xylosus]